jgi:rieske iron-sulfur protein
MSTARERPDARVCGCGAPTSRRGVLAGASVLGLNAALGTGTGTGTGTGIAPATAEPADERPKEGDHLVAIDAPTPVALAPKDIMGASLIVWPMDPASNVVRSGLRLNKVLLVRLDPATLVGVTRERAADGVVAYSAICPHAGCEVSGWVEELMVLECPCHNSRYNPREGGAVVDGPTTRGLAALPLKVADGKLVVAKPFAGRVGIAPS